MDSQAHYDKMTKKPLARLIIELGIPTTISMLVTNIYNMADTYFVGTLGKSQQASIGILFTLQTIIQAIAFMIGQGSGTLIAKALAEQNKKEASEYASTGFFVSVFLGLLLSVTGFLFLEPFMKLLGSTQTILPYAKLYGSCVLFTAPLVMGSFVLNNALRFEGKSFYAMIGLVSGGIINIIGDYVMVVILKMGVLGAGIATALSQCVSFTLLLIMFKISAQSSISLKAVSRNVKVYKTISKVGVPALIRQGLTSFSNGLLNNLTAPFGDAAIAAMSVVNRFSSFLLCLGLGIGQGFQPVCAFNYQAKEYKRVKKGMLITMEIGFLCMICIAIPGFIFANEIVQIFQKSRDVVEIGAVALRFTCIGTTFMTLSVPVNMLYQSIRKSGICSFLSMLRSGLILIPTLLITTRLWGIGGIQSSQAISDVLTGIISIPFIINIMNKKDNQWN